MVADAGASDYDGVGFLGIAVRTSTPQEVIDLLNRALASPEISKHIAGNGLGGGTPADFGTFLARDKAIWIKVVAAGGIRAE